STWYTRFSKARSGKQRPVQRRPPTSTASRTRSGVSAKNVVPGSPATPDTIARRQATFTGGYDARTPATDRAGSARLDPVAQQLGTLGQGRPARRHQSHHPGQALGGRPARQERPQRVAQSALPQGAGPEQPAAGSPLHEDAHARQGRLFGRLLRPLLSPHRLH